MMLQFTVPGTPRGKARARVVRRNGRTWAYTPKATREYEHTARWLALAVRPPSWPMDGRYSLRVYCVGGRSDGDNCLKAIADALEGALYANDRQVCHAEVRKDSLSRATKPARTEVTVEVLS